MTRPDNVMRWTDQDWLDFRDEKLRELVHRVGAGSVESAYAYLREKFDDELKADLRARIAENPARWIGGRKDIECPSCKGTGVDALREAGFDCFWCKGKGRAREEPLHHGWGTAIRNLLRQGGFDDTWAGGNLDDYYTGLVELAVKEDAEPKSD